MNKEKIGMLKEKYRRGVGMMIINKNQEIFIGQRFEKDKSAWQMPQGGIDKGEKKTFLPRFMLPLSFSELQINPMRLKSQIIFCTNRPICSCY